MTAWLLLLVTVGCAYVTYDAFRWRGDLEKAPFSVIASMWKGGLSYMSLAEQDRVKKQYASRTGGGEICWLFLVVTVVMFVATARAFVE